MEFKERGWAILRSYVASQADYGRDDSPPLVINLADDDGEAAPKCRPDGMNTMQKIEHDQDGVWCFSRDLAVEELARVLTARQDACDRHRIDGASLLPREHQEEMKTKLFDYWKLEHPDQLLAIQNRRGVKHKICRDVRSIYRTWCFDTFGGQEWLWIIIAIGYMDVELLECMNKALVAKKEEIRERAAAGGPVWQDPALAPPRERGPVRGTQHHKSTPKLLREAAKKQDSEVRKQEELWTAGHSRLTMKQWGVMVATRDGMWDEAEEASMKAGVEFMDRNGVRQLTRKDDGTIVGWAIKAYQARPSRHVEAKKKTGKGASASAPSRG